MLSFRCISPFTWYKAVRIERMLLEVGRMDGWIKTNAHLTYSSLGGKIHQNRSDQMQFVKQWTIAYYI